VVVLCGWVEGYFGQFEFFGGARNKNKGAKSNCPI